MTAEISFSIESASMRDLKEVYEIELSSFPRYPYSISVLVSFLTLFPELFLIARHEERIVGYIAGFMEKEDRGHIASIAVRQEYRGRGIGRKLLEEEENKMRNLNVKEVVLEVSENNEVAIRLYTSMGYKKIKRVKNYYPDGSAAFIMKKTL
ncbi:MAG: ribosomal-protein-alanine N-acetyltransferase [Fervidicoccus fontis]|nr:MAG: ribosomal-protein-alanine N-acetyltransferase [Fervidicoccus fontis]